MAKNLITMIDIIVEEEHIYRSKRGAITAPIYFDFGGYKFPEEGWSDFIVVISGWWIDAILKLINGWESEVELCFMDGPMLIKIKLNGGKNLSLECIDQRGQNDLVEYHGVFSQDSIVTILLANSRKILQLCDEHNWQSDDIDNLVKLTVALTKSIK